jgi:hypothetical protein
VEDKEDLYQTLLQMQLTAVTCAQFGCPVIQTGGSPFSVSLNRRDPSNRLYSGGNAEVCFHVFNLTSFLTLFSSGHIFSRQSPAWKHAAPES